jgi:hypothetical protein
MKRTLCIAWLACATQQALPPGAADAATTAKDRRFVSARNGISVEAPTGWTLSTHTGFPSILVLLLHPDGSRISVAVAESPAKTARELADSNRRGLDAQGLKVVGVRASAREGVEVEAQSAARAETVVQLYLLRALASGSGSRQAVVITMTTPTAALALHRPALDYVIGKLGLNPLPEAASQPHPASGKPPSAAERPAEETHR